MDPAIRALVPPAAVLVGPAVTVLACEDHLSVLVALGRAEPGSVLVVATGGGRRAVAGELFATEAARRGLVGLVVDGHVRDLRGLRSVGLPVYARGTTPASGGTVAPHGVGVVVPIGGVHAAPGDLVVGDEDGLVLAPPDRFAALLDTAEEIERAERALLDGMAAGRRLASMTDVDEHLARLAAGGPSRLGFRV